MYVYGQIIPLKKRNKAIYLAIFFPYLTNSIVFIKNNNNNFGIHIKNDYL